MSANSGWQIMVGAVLVGLLGMPMAAEAEAYRSFSDWSVSCGNGLTCSLSTDDLAQPIFPTLEFVRHSAPNAPVELTLSVSSAGLGDKADGTFSAAVDGKVLFEAPVSTLDYRPDDMVVALTDNAGVLALLDAMRAGKVLVLTVSSASGKAERTVSLAGLSASLLFLDEAQARLKRTDALIAKGDIAPPEHASSRDIVRFDDLPESLRPIFSDPNAECGGFEETSLHVIGAFAMRFDDGDELIAMPCAPGGAYNQAFVLYAGQGDNFDLVSVPVMTDAGPGTETLPYNLDMDWPNRRLNSVFKGRGLGDCGSSFVWQLPASDREASEIVLTEQRVKGECDGDDGGGSDKWPLVWPIAAKK